MASGHVNRANRPNTWLLRPSLLREDIPCQSGAAAMASPSRRATARRSTSAAGRTGQHCPKAIAVVAKCLDSADEKVRLMAAKPCATGSETRRNTTGTVLVAEATGPSARLALPPFGGCCRAILIPICSRRLSE
jgi:hypothetical protein